MPTDDAPPLAPPRPPQPSALAASPRPEHLGWRSILVGGAVLFVILAVVLFATGNPNLYPTAALVGSFLVPVAFVAYLSDHLHRTALSFEALVWAFVLGGVLGILGASILEPLLLPRLFRSASSLGFPEALVVGAIEEACKLAAVAFVARRMVHVGARNGLLLGAAVGMGFAAFESLGYAFTVLFATGGDVIASLQETVLRALLAPFGHGIWTGVLAAALFHDSAPERWRVGPTTIVAFLLVATLHGAWDGLALGGVVLVLGTAIPMSTVAVTVVGLAAFGLAYAVPGWRRPDARVGPGR